MDEDDMFNVVEEQAKEGVDFFTIHVGVTKEIVDYLVDHPRTMGVVSRGGTFLASWILENEMENPFNRRYDYLLEMAQEYDFTLSLGDGMRPGCIFDSTDYAQIQELLEISKLVKRAWKENVQVMVEGPGHIPANEIERNIDLKLDEKSLTSHRKILGKPIILIKRVLLRITGIYSFINPFLDKQTQFNRQSFALHQASLLVPRKIKNRMKQIEEKISDCEENLIIIMEKIKDLHLSLEQQKNKAANHDPTVKD